MCRKVMFGLLLLLILSIPFTILAKISGEKKQREIEELVEKAIGGDQEALGRITGMSELETDKHPENLLTKKALYHAIFKNPNSLFVPVLLHAYQYEIGKPLVRDILRCISNHYDYHRDAFFELFKERLRYSMDGFELDLVSLTLIGALYRNNEIDKIFPMLHGLYNKIAERSILKHLALRIGREFYGDVCQPYQEYLPSFPPCELEKFSYLSADITKTVVLKDSLTDYETQVLLKNLEKEEGIYWTLLGLLREEKPEINDSLLKWMERAPIKMNRYKMFVSLKLKGVENSFGLLEELAAEYPNKCKRCLYVVSSNLGSSETKEGLPEYIKDFVKWITKRVLLDSISLKNLKGDVESIGISELLSIQKSDTVYVLLRGISIKPFTVSGKNIVFARDETHFESLMKGTEKNWGLLISFKWRGDYLLARIGTAPPDAKTTGGYADFLLKNINGEWRLATFLMGATK